MADKINGFVDNLELYALNSLTHLLNTEDTDELNIIQHSPYYNDNDNDNDNEITLFRHIFIIYKIYFTSAYVLITLVIKTYMCPGDLISAKLCRYHKATKIISKYVLQ